MLFLAFALAILVPEDPQVVDGVIVRPQWVQTPTAGQMTPDVGRTDYNPVGTVELTCSVLEGGGLDDCRINSLPVAYPELGRVAFDASEHFRHAARLENGETAAGLSVRLKLRWELPED
ncbi:hypothetical protein [Brevundimonas sp.]|uniref:hypothetical protein n=1 Tax=Brevundimonas sp. TaxID=1871086 RepID=UPI002D46B54D|nr:hypothetical protein [Brevundimonas sp.]HYC99006.1 hypothetical protein [Brevundimonas sp.]